RRSSHRTKILSGRRWLLGHDLSRIEDVRRIENLLDLAKHFVQWSCLSLDERRATEPSAMLTADRAAHIKHVRIEFVRQILHLSDFFGNRQIEKRTDVQLPMPCVRVKRGCNLVPLEDVLQPHQEIR